MWEQSRASQSCTQGDNCLAILCCCGTSMQCGSCLEADGSIAAAPDSMHLTTFEHCLLHGFPTLSASSA